MGRRFKKKKEVKAAAEAPADKSTIFQAGLRTLHEAGPELHRTISTDLEAMMAEEMMTTRRNHSLLGQLTTEFKKHTSPLPRQKKLTSDFTDLPVDPRTEASEVTVERLITKFIPSGAQVKEVFNTIPQYAFQDIPEQPRVSPSRFSPPVRAPDRSPRTSQLGPPPLEGVQAPAARAFSPPRPARRRPN